MKPVKAMTIRLSPEQAEELETIATVDELPVSDVVRAAIARHIEERRTDELFRRSLQDRIDRARRLLDDPAGSTVSLSNTRSSERTGDGQEHR